MDTQPIDDRQMTIGSLRELLQDFVKARDWARFHQPRALAAALSVEAGELQELFLWTEPGIEGHRPPPERSRLEAEVADVAICLLNLCNQTGIDLSLAVQRKLEHNALKYPIERSRGIATKYDALPADLRPSSTGASSSQSPGKGE